MPELWGEIGRSGTMISDTERRDVARRLREAASCYEIMERDVDFYPVESALGLKPTGETTYAPESVRSLADLIEPSERACYYDSETNRCGCYDTRPVDLERLLAIATLMAADSVRSVKQGINVSPVYILHAARNIAEACGETFGSIRNRELAKWGTSIVPKEMIVDRDALLKLAEEMEQAGKEYRYQANENAVYSDLIDDAPEEFIEYARRIREALGVES